MFGRIFRREYPTISNVIKTSATVPLTFESEGYGRLVHLMRTKLPQELVDQIEETVYRLAFCPGLVFFPFQFSPSERTHEWKGQAYDVIRPELLTLSKAIHSRWSERLWSENTFVIGAGYPNYFKRFMADRTARALCKRIRKVHLEFTLRDRHHGCPPSWKSLTPQDLRAGLNQVRDSQLDVGYLPTGPELVLDMQGVWSMKSLFVTSLSLTHLTLDFTDAYGHDGGFLGLDFCQCRIFFFRRGKKIPELRIIAPNHEKEGAILRALQAKITG